MPTYLDVLLKCALQKIRTKDVQKWFILRKNSVKIYLFVVQKMLYYYYQLDKFFMDNFHWFSERKTKHGQTFGQEKGGKHCCLPPGKVGNIAYLSYLK